MLNRCGSESEKRSVKKEGNNIITQYNIFKGKINEAKKICCSWFPASPIHLKPLRFSSGETCQQLNKKNNIMIKFNTGCLQGWFRISLLFFQTWSDIRLECRQCFPFMWFPSAFNQLNYFHFLSSELPRDGMEMQIFGFRSTGGVYTTQGLIICLRWLGT